MSKEKTPKAKVKQLRSFDPAKRAARNATVKARNEHRRAERRKEAEQRNASWQALSLEQQLEACKKSPWNKAKQITKLKRKIEERNERDRAGKTVSHRDDSVRRKPGDGASRRTAKKGGRTLP